MAKSISAARSSARTHGPAGRDAVVAAALDAAADLFAERGPAATSIRDVAARAGINHGLIHRHFGSKEGLVGAVLDYLGGYLAELAAGSAKEVEIEAAIDRQLRVIARTILDGFPAEELQTRFPNMNDLLPLSPEGFVDARSGRLALVNAVAMQIGCRLFGDFLTASAGLKKVSQSELSRSLALATRRVLTPDD